MTRFSALPIFFRIDNNSDSRDIPLTLSILTRFSNTSRIHLSYLRSFFPFGDSLSQGRTGDYFVSLFLWNLTAYNLSLADKDNSPRYIQDSSDFLERNKIAKEMIFQSLDECRQVFRLDFTIGFIGEMHTYFFYIFYRTDYLFICTHTHLLLYVRRMKLFFDAQRNCEKLRQATYPL